MSATPYTDSKHLVGVYDGEDKDEPLVGAKDCAALETVAARMAEALEGVPHGRTCAAFDIIGRPCTCGNDKALAEWKELLK